METSAKDSTNVEQAFMAMAAAIKTRYHLHTVNLLSLSKNLIKGLFGVVYVLFYFYFVSVKNLETNMFDKYLRLSFYIYQDE